MTAVVASVVRSGHTFLGGAAQTSWATWGGGGVTGRHDPLVTTP
jgi:hypothetical protein